MSAEPGAGAPSMPLLETKLHAPRRRRAVVPRERLALRLRPVDLPPLVLVSAPAGFGKSTLLAEWARGAADQGVRTAWLSLERTDSDPAVFWSYVVAALRTVAPEVGTEALATLPTSPAALESVVGLLVNDLAGLSAEVALVLDDYHVIESIPVHESVLFLVEHLPAHVHLLLASRSDPPWPLGGLRARGDLLEVRAADLRFSADEARTYLTDEMGLDLTAADVDALGARTEGWIAALQLAALSLQGRDDPSGFIAGFAGDDRFVVDYLVDEVLDRQTDDTRTFLLDTSILSRLSAPLCAAVTGREDARATLDALERANLFLVALDDRREWYRYHHLFAEVLRARLADDPTDRGVERHRRASAWWEGEGDRAEAIRHALAAGDVERAAELIELSVSDLRRTRQDATLRAWMDALPDEVFADRPVLNLGRVGARMVTSDVDGVAALLDDVEAWLDPERPKDRMVVHDHAEMERLPAQAAMYRAGLALLDGDIHATIGHGTRAVTLADPDDHLGRGAAAALIALAQWTGGHLRAAAEQYATAIAEFVAATYWPAVLGCSLGLADIQVGLGRLGAAERTLTTALDLTRPHGPQRGVADVHVGLAEVRLERDERTAAAADLDRSLEVGEHLALAQHAHRWRVVAARLRSIDGDHAGALDLLREAEQRYDTDYSPPARPVGASTARVHLAAGDLAAALSWAAASGLTVDDEATYLREHEHLTLARVLIASGRSDDALPLVERLLAAADAGGREGSAVEGRLLLALAVDARGDRRAAVDALADALDRAAGERLVRTFLDAGAPATDLLRAVAGEGRAVDLASALLAATGAPSEAQRPQVLVDELSRREIEVLRLLRTDLTGPEIAAELVVSLNTVRSHTKSIFSKLGVTNRLAAIRRADELGL
jgi:LuxR family maltose regulon positive regulatory protein